MAEENPSSMNLDLNLRPMPDPEGESLPSVALNLDQWIEEPYRRLRDVARLRARQRRWRRIPISPERRDVSMDLSEFVVSTREGAVLQAGEGSVGQEGRIDELQKACENVAVNLEAGAPEGNDVSMKGIEKDGSFFDCNICFDLAKDPVVSCCGHLFCWPCLYRWLHVSVDVKECPMCKGEVTVKNVTPIYGRGNGKPKDGEDKNADIPLRPQAHRIESLRQTLHRTAFNVPIEELIRRVRSRFDLTRDLVQSLETNNIHETDERNAARIDRLSHDFHENAARTASLIDRLLAARIHREQISGPPPTDEIVDLTQSGNAFHEVGEARRSHQLLLRRSHAYRTAAVSSLSSTLGSAERILEYLHTHSGRNHEHHPPGDDRDSFPSIAAVINSESQVDAALEIDSMGSLSTSTSRRRADGSSRASDIDSWGDSRPPRRRRLNGGMELGAFASPSSGMS
ncbi:hypothetical protein MLD38_021420 [Melastoma candidum]|uniref:Uncharacterized protein n=1 Tax=Melastoma candidum TaxID=119954 RepID=A0ACB9QGK3_9MYRT|nr:hypothetical protein MLD38_021420 [Melastoma candidum]